MSDTNGIIEEIGRLEKEAYQRGWNDAADNILAAARQGKSAVIRLGPDMPLAPISSKDETGGERVGPSTPVIDVICDVINDRPGLRGADIFREAVNRVPGSEFKKMDRTGRTALARLKNRGRIYQRSKKWYPKKETKNEAPTVGSPAP